MTSSVTVLEVSVREKLGVNNKILIKHLKTEKMESNKF